MHLHTQKQVYSFGIFIGIFSFFILFPHFIYAATAKDEASCLAIEGQCANPCPSGSASFGYCSNDPNDWVHCCKGSSTGTLPPVSSSYDYTLLEPIPGFEVTDPSPDFPRYLVIIYNFGIWGVGIAAMFMIIVGSFWYLTAAGNNAQLATAKKIIFDALIGLVVAFGAWLILFIINPDLTKVDLKSLSELSVNWGSGNMPMSGPITPGGGRCHGINLGNGVSGCDLVSGEMGGILKCMVENGINDTGGIVMSITSNATGNNLEASKACCGSNADSCPHSTTSCHHGCKAGNKGYSYAIDYSGIMGDPQKVCKVAKMAIQCGSKKVLGPNNKCGMTKAKGHDDHLHISAPPCNG